MSNKFPTVRYHQGEEPKVVKSQEELDALGKGWSDSPAAAAKPEHPEHPEHPKHPVHPEHPEPEPEPEPKATPYKGTRK